jgi:hypothetical protein
MESVRKESDIRHEESLMKMLGSLVETELGEIKILMLHCRDELR